MADFPGKVNTQTSSHQSRTGPVQIMNMSIDLNFINSVPGILLLVEILFGLLVWPLVASAVYWLVPAYGWVLFISITLWILTIVIYFMLIFSIRINVSSIPWPLVLMVFYGVASVLYFTAFLANAVTVHYFSDFTFNHMATSAFFSICVTLAYVASTVFAFLEWKHDGGNAAMSTVPV